VIASSASPEAPRGPATTDSGEPDDGGSDGGAADDAGQKGDAKVHDAHADAPDSGADAAGNDAESDAPSCGAETLCGQTCVDLATNAGNCGACGHDCQGGTCSAGACQPVVLVTESAGTSALTIAQDASNIYWAEVGPTNAIRGASKKNLSSVFTNTSSNFPNEIAVDATNLYWTDGGHGNVTQCPLAGGACTVLASNLSQPHGIASTGASVFFGDNNALYSCAVNGCNKTPTQQSTVMVDYAVAVDGSNAYWVGAGGVYTCPISGCNGSPTKLASAVGGTGIAVDATDAYWLGSDGSVSKVAKNGGSATQLTPTASNPGYGIALDATNVYWAPMDGSVWKCAIGGCGMKPTQVAPAAQNFDLFSDGLVVDDTRIYWTTDSAVLAVAK
jgi:hypothetical protein